MKIIIDKDCWIVSECLGRGKHFTTYKAINDSDHSHIILKVFTGEKKSQESIKRRMLGFNALLSGNDLNYISQIRIKEEKGILYLLQQPQKGLILSNFIPTSSRQLALLFHNLIRIVDSIHEKGYLLLDIKADNFLLLDKESADIRLIDFDSITQKGDAGELHFTFGFCSPLLERIALYDLWTKTYWNTDGELHEQIHDVLIKLDPSFLENPIYVHEKTQEATGQISEKDDWYSLGLLMEEMVDRLKRQPHRNEHGELELERFIKEVKSGDFNHMHALKFSEALTFEETCWGMFSQSAGTLFASSIAGDDPVVHLLADIYPMFDRSFFKVWFKRIESIIHKYQEEVLVDELDETDLSDIHSLIIAMQNDQTDDGFREVMNLYSCARLYDILSTFDIANDPSIAISHYQKLLDLLPRVDRSYIKDFRVRLNQWNGMIERNNHVIKELNEISLKNRFLLMVAPLECAKRQIYERINMLECYMMLNGDADENQCQESQQKCESMDYLIKKALDHYKAPNLSFQLSLAPRYKTCVNQIMIDKTLEKKREEPKPLSIVELLGKQDDLTGNEESGMIIHYGFHGTGSKRQAIEWTVLDNKDGQLVMLANRALENAIVCNQEGRLLISSGAVWDADRFIQDAFKDKKESIVSLNPPSIETINRYSSCIQLRCKPSDCAQMSLDLLTQGLDPSFKKWIIDDGYCRWWTSTTDQMGVYLTVGPDGIIEDASYLSVDEIIFRKNELNILVRPLLVIKVNPFVINS